MLQLRRGGGCQPWVSAWYLVGGRLVGLEGVLVGVCGEVTKAAQEMPSTIWVARGLGWEGSLVPLQLPKALLRGSE